MVSSAGGIRYDFKLKNLNVLSKIAPEYRLGGSLGLSGYVKGSFEKPRVMVNGSGSDLTYDEKRVRVKKLELTAEGNLDLSNLDLTAKGEAKGIDIQGREIQLINL